MVLYRLFLFIVCFGERCCSRFERHAMASWRIFQILEIKPIGRICLAGDIFNGGDCSH